MKIRGKRRTYKLGLFNVTRSGFRPTSVTLDLGFWRGIIWERKRKH